MSIDYDADLVVGFYIEFDLLKKALGQKVGEEFHMEPRWDPKTGKRVSDEKVVDETGGLGMFIRGEEIERLDVGSDYDIPQETMDRLADLIGKGGSWYYNESEGGFGLGFGPDIGMRRTTLKTIERLWNQALAAQIKLGELGIRVMPEIFARLSIT